MLHSAFRKRRVATLVAALLLFSNAAVAFADPPVVDENLFPLDLYSVEGRSEAAFLVAFMDKSLYETGFQSQWTLTPTDATSWQDAGNPIAARNPPQYPASGYRPNGSYTVLPEVCALSNPSPPVPTQDTIFFRTRAMFTHGVPQIPSELDLINGPWYYDPAIAGPCAPRSVSVALSGSTPILSWVNVHNYPTDPLKAGYYIYRSTNPNTLGSTSTLLTTLTDPNANSFVDNMNPPAGVRVHYAVVGFRQKTIDGKVEIGKSVGKPLPVSIDVPGGGPSPTPTPTVSPTATPTATPTPTPEFDPPSNLTAVLVNSTTAKLDWQDNSTTESGFFVDFGPDSCACNGRIVIPSPNVTTYQQGGLPQDAFRYYRVRAYRNSDGGITEPSNLALVGTPPFAPTNLRTGAPASSAPAVTNAYVDMQWNDNSQTEDGFRIDRCLGSCGDSGTWSLVGTVGANTITFRDGTVTGSTTYSYRVFATKGLATSPRSNILVVNTPPTPLIPPSNLNASMIAGEAHKLSLTWQNNDPNTQSYRIEYSATPAGPWGTLATGIGTTSYTDDFALNAGQQRCYRVRAFHSTVGASDPSNIDCANTDGPQIPVDPTNLSGVALDHARIELTWTDNATNEDGFKIYRSTDGGQTYLLWKTLVNTDPALVFCGGACRRHVVTGLYPATPYTFKVTAFNQDGESGPSNSVTLPTLGPPMPQWTNPSPENQGFTNDGEPINDSIYTCEISGTAQGTGVDFVKVRVYDTVQGKFLTDPPWAAVHPTTREWEIRHTQYAFNPGRYNLVAYSHVTVNGQDVFSQPAYINGWTIPADHAPCPITDP